MRARATDLSDVLSDASNVPSEAAILEIRDRRAAMSGGKFWPC